MTRRTTSYLLLALAVLSAAAVIYFKCNSQTVTATRSNNQVERVLFIGNSLTYVNDLPKTLSQIAQSLGDTVIYDMYAPGGYTLAQDAKDQTALGKIASKPWDFVVLQEQSELPALQDSLVNSEVIPYAIQLDDDIHASWPKARTVFFETWGYQNGDTQYCPTNPTLCSYPLMQNQLTKSYGIMAQKTGGIIAPVGEAWRLVRNTHPEINLYADDRHPSVNGTYLAAAVIYMTLFKKDIAGASPLALDKKTAAILQNAASQTVLEQF